MFGGRGGGRGRGSRGGRSGPRLPAKLSKELFGEADAGSGGRGRKHLPRKERRRAERDARRGGANAPGGTKQDKQQRQRTTSQALGANGRGAGRKGADGPSAKRQKLSGRALTARGGSKFEQLLPAHLQAQGDRDPELELQRQLARQLGLKKGKVKMGGDDGLDEFLEELGGIDDIFGSDSEGGSAAQGGKASGSVAGRKRKQPDAAGGGRSNGGGEGLSDGSEGSMGEEEEDGLEELMEGGGGDTFEAEEEDSDGDEGSEGSKEEEGTLGDPGGSSLDGSSEEGSLLAGLESEEESGGSLLGEDDGGNSGEEGDDGGSRGGRGSEEDGSEEQQLAPACRGAATAAANGQQQRHKRQRKGGGVASGERQQGSSDEGASEEDEEGQDGLLATGGSSGDSQGEEGSSGGEQADERAEEGPRRGHQQPATATGKYVPPAARRAAAADGGGGAASEAAARVERRVRGLLNRLAEANLQGIVSDLASLYEQEGRRLVSDAVCAELIATAADGPRASDRFAAVTAASIAGLAGTVRAAEVVANFLDRLGGRLEAAVASGDGLCCRNLVMVAAHLYLAGALKADLVYSMLHSWRQRFTEADVSMIVTLLHAAGLQLRSADPVAMKEFVVAVHARAAEVGTSASGSGGSGGSGGGLSKRAQVLLELVVDVKNNRRRDEAKHKAVVLAPAIGKWLKASGAADVALGGISWSKVLQPNKKGIWWMPEASDAQPQRLGGGAALQAAAAEVAAAAAGEGGLAGPELLKLAAGLRMNTDVRRAVFCVVMGAEDCVDAVERLLRLGLKGKLEREVVRVTVECCLQEKAWNAYYAHLLLRLCGAGKSHKMTLQFCFWDQLKELPGIEVRRLTNLARLMATVLAAFALPPTMLKVADFSDGLSAREVLFWRIFFEHLLASCKTREDAASFFKRIAAQPELKPLRVALISFLRRSVGPWLAARQPGSGGLSTEQLAELLRRLRGAEKALASFSG